MPSSGGGTGTPITGGGIPATSYSIGDWPLLPLETFRQKMGYNPYHFWGMTNSLVPVTSACNSLIHQHAWQSQDAAGREQILEAIMTAEHRLEEYLGYSIGPRYRSKTLLWPRYADKAVWRGLSMDADGRRVGVSLGESKVQAVGLESLTLLATVALTYSDADGDGLNDHFSLSTPTTLTDSSEIAVYFATGDRLDNEGVSEKWRVKPIQVSITGGNIVVSGKSWLLVKPILYEGVSVGDINPSTAANFVSTLEVYRRTTSTEGEAISTSQAVLLWETLPCHGWFCTCDVCSGVSYVPIDSSYDPAAVGMAIARAGIRDAEAGIVIPDHAVRDSTTGIWASVDWTDYREPDKVLVRYLAGQPLGGDGQLSGNLQTIIARLAAAELGRRICACDFANQELYHWQFDLARAAGANDEQYSISSADLDNPWGTRRGQVYAWKQVRNLRVQRGLALL